MTETRKSKSFPVYILSGGVGATGEQLARTVLAQFSDSRVSIEMFPKILSWEEAEKVLRQAAEQNAVVVHSFVDPDLRRKAIRLSDELKITAIDLVGPLMNELSNRLGRDPLGTPGLYRQLYESYFDRVEAMDYSLAHDDGKQPDGWKEAEIVLVGASRVGKTPVSLYLSVLGWKVANVPLVAGIRPDRELFRLDMRRVVGLTISPSDLLEHRRHRQRRLGLLDNRTDYVDPVKIFEEIDSAERLLKRHGIPVIDVTGKPIETSADEVIHLINRKIKQ